MSKEPQKTNEDVIAKLKAEEEAKKTEAAKAEQAEADRIAAEQSKDDPSKEPKNVDPKLRELAAREAARIAAAEKDESDIPVAEDKPGMHERRAKAKIAFDKISFIAMSYPRTTPDEHVIFGYGAHRFRLGDLRDLTNTR